MKKKDIDAIYAADREVQRLMTLFILALKNGREKEARRYRVKAEAIKQHILRKYAIVL